MHKKKKSGLVLKLDFKKAYDKMKWPFLQQVLRIKGFAPKWCAWIDQVVSKGAVGVKVNDDLGHYFQTRKGVRQRDPLSPIHFDIVRSDMLAVLIARTKECGQVTGVILYLVDDGLSILQYADGTILFMEDDLDQAKNVKLLLGAFEQLSGLRSIFIKSEFLCYGEAKDREMEY